MAVKEYEPTDAEFDTETGGALAVTERLFDNAWNGTTVNERKRFTRDDFETLCVWHAQGRNLRGLYRPYWEDPELGKQYPEGPLHSIVKDHRIRAPYYYFKRILGRPEVKFYVDAVRFELAPPWHEFLEQGRPVAQEVLMKAMYDYLEHGGMSREAVLVAMRLMDQHLPKPKPGEAKPDDDRSGSRKLADEIRDVAGAFSEVADMVSDGRQMASERAGDILVEADGVELHQPETRRVERSRHPALRSVEGALGVSPEREAPVASGRRRTGRQEPVEFPGISGEDQARG